MRKILFSSLLVAGAAGAFAQSGAKLARPTNAEARQPRLQAPSALADQAPANMMELPRTKSVNILPEPTFGRRIGYTYTNVQAYGPQASRVIRTPQGHVTVIWNHNRFGTRGTFFTTGQMAGYNSFTPGQGWYANGNLEDSLKYAVAGEAAAYRGTQFANQDTSIKYGRNVGFPSLVQINGKEAVLHAAVLQNEWSIATNAATAPSVGGLIGSRAAMASRVPGTRGAGTNKWGRFAALPSFPSAVTPYRFNYASTPQNYTIFFSNSGGKVKFASNGNTLHAVAYNTVDTVGTGTYSNLIYARSTDEGSNWTVSTLPGTDRSNYITGLNWMTDPYTIEARGNTVAVVANFLTTAPENGISAILFKSSDNGATWTSRVIDRVNKRDILDSGGRASATGNGFILNDGAYTILIDNNDKVHVAVGKSYTGTDTLGLNNSISVYLNGGYVQYFNEGNANLLYWNEDFPAGKPFKEAARLVDGNRNGQLDYPGGTTTANPAEPGDYLQGVISQAAFSMDQSGRIYIFYSAIQENTAPAIVDQVTRDIYVIASDNGGENWTSPINLAFHLMRSGDGSNPGDGVWTETFPSVNKYTNADDTLSISWLSSDQFGPGAYGTQYYSSPTATTWFPYAVYYAAFKADSIWNTQLHGKFPESACAGTAVNFSYRVPTWVPNGTVLQVQLDTSLSSVSRPAGVFNTNNNTIQNCGTVTVNGATGTGTLTIPANTPIANGYRIRLFNPAAPNWFYGEYDINVSSGLPVAPLAPRPVNNSLSACAGTRSSYRITDPTPLPVTYQLTISPAAAGTAIDASLNGDGSLQTITWNPTFSGQVTLSAVCVNSCGTSAAGPSITVTITTNTITRTGNNLTAAQAGEWFFNGNAIGNFGTTQPVLQGQTAGVYECVVPGGCRGSIQIGSTLGPVGLNPTLATSLNIYPNPARNFVNVELKGWATFEATQVSLLNQVGQVVSSEVVNFDGTNGTARIETGNLAKGVYFVRIVSEGQSAVRRIVIE